MLSTPNVLRSCKILKMPPRETKICINYKVLTIKVTKCCQFSSVKDFLAIRKFKQAKKNSKNHSKMQKFIAITLAAASQAQIFVNHTDISFEEGPEERKFSHIVKMVYSQITTAHSSKTISKMM